LTGSPESGNTGPLAPGTALVVVDVQNDFCPGGALPVPGGDRVVPVINRIAARFRSAGLPVVFTRDWHPDGHSSFQGRGGPWPAHCVSETNGAAFHPDLDVAAGDMIISKATVEGRDAYSGFEETGLAGILRERGVGRILVGGLATEYCVKATVLDGLREGFEVALLLDGIAGIDANPGDVDRALREMEAAGAIKKGQK